MIDFKKAEGHYKPSLDVLNYFKEISSKDINNLPSHDPLYLKEAIAKVLDVNINRICIGNGSSEILMLLTHIKGYSKEHLVVTPTYDPFFKAINSNKGIVHNISLNEVDDFEWTQDTTDQVLKLVKKNPTLIPYGYAHQIIHVALLYLYWQ